MDALTTTLQTAVLPEHVLHSAWFGVLASFVALNTIMYCALSLAKVLPKLYLSDWVTSTNRRSQTRSIYPDGYVVPDEVTEDLLDPVA
jgi:hypothetical protein